MPEPRGPLPPDVRRAAKTVSRAMWRTPYRDGEGVMHFGGGPAHARLLLDQANRWEQMAAAARVCADWLGDGSFPGGPASTPEGAAMTHEWNGHHDGVDWCMEVEVDCFSNDEPFVVAVWITCDESPEPCLAPLSATQAREVAAALLTVADSVDYNNARPDVLAAREARTGGADA